MTKRTIALFLTLAMLFAMVGCKKGTDTPAGSSTSSTGSSSSGAVSSALPPEQEPVPETDPDSAPVERADIIDLPKQLKLLADSADLWLNTDDDAEQFQYAVTDLDENGRLEIISEVCGGSGMFSTTAFYEVNEALDGLTRLDYDGDKADSSQPDLSASFPTVYRQNGKCSYIVFDFLHDGDTDTDFRSILVLENGTVRLTPLGSIQTVQFVREDGEWDAHMHYFDAEGASISEEEYEKLETDRFSRSDEAARAFGWDNPANYQSVDAFLEWSYQVSRYEPESNDMDGGAVELPELGSPIMEVCKAYARTFYEIGSMDVADPYYWTFVARAVSNVVLRNADADEDGNLFMDEVHIRSYTRCMFGSSPVPALDAGITYTEGKEEPYTIPADLTAAGCEIVSVDYLPDSEESVVSVLVDVEQDGEHGSVTLLLLGDPNPSNIFGYQITYAEMGMG